tara:strand:+ start:1186 stop:2187 length:1002 start_codon:yes stop_codon:yes gene_type:complete
MLSLTLFLSFFITIFLFNKYNKILSLKLNLIDIPNERKKHHKPVPLTGGIFFLILLFETVLILDFFRIENINIVTILFSFLIFGIGIVDDKIDINANLKLIYLIFIITIFLNFEENFQISFLKFSILNDEVNLGIYKTFFTILCILLLINAFNMSDGINGLFLCYSIISFIYLYTSYIEHNIYLLIIIVILIICFLFNIQNKFFLGDGGVFLISFLLSLELIQSYKSSFSNIKVVDEIFLILMFPGLDMLRLFCQRIKNKRNPFRADNNHLHHLLLKITNNKISLLLCLCLHTIPILIFKLEILNILNSIILGLGIYIITLTFLFTQKNFNEE